jgi:hypothetical protein
VKLRKRLVFGRAQVLQVDDLAQHVQLVKCRYKRPEQQPETAEWNRLGYGNNSIQRVTIY